MIHVHILYIAKHVFLSKFFQPVTPSMVSYFPFPQSCCFSPQRDLHGPLGGNLEHITVMDAFIPCAMMLRTSRLFGCDRILYHVTDRIVWVRSRDGIWEWSIQHSLGNSTGLIFIMRLGLFLIQTQNALDGCHCSMIIKRLTWHTAGQVSGHLTCSDLWWVTCSVTWPAPSLPMGRERCGCGHVTRLDTSRVTCPIMWRAPSSPIGGSYRCSISAVVTLMSRDDIGALPQHGPLLVGYAIGGATAWAYFKKECHLC